MEKQKEIYLSTLSGLAHIIINDWSDNLSFFISTILNTNTNTLSDVKYHITAFVGSSVTKEVAIDESFSNYDEAVARYTELVKLYKA